MLDLEQDPDRAMELCNQAEQRLSTRVSLLEEDDVRESSRLPGWSIGHVLTHLARNADAHARRLEGALVGNDVPKYPGGEAQRATEVEDGAARPADTIVRDLITSQERLAAAMQGCSARGWPHSDFVGGGHYGVKACPAHRLREIEMHHVDLGLGYAPQDWPEEYVDWDLGVLLSTVPERLRSSSDRRIFMAWLAGRTKAMPVLDLDAW